MTFFFKVNLPCFRLLMGITLWVRMWFVITSITEKRRKANSAKAIWKMHGKKIARVRCERFQHKVYWCVVDTPLIGEQNKRFGQKFPRDCLENCKVKCWSRTRSNQCGTAGSTSIGEMPSFNEKCRVSRKLLAMLISVVTGIESSAPRSQAVPRGHYVKAASNNHSGKLRHFTSTDCKWGIIFSQQNWPELNY